jgi:hypothetical protein
VKPPHRFASVQGLTRSWAGIDEAGIFGATMQAGPFSLTKKRFFSRNANETPPSRAATGAPLDAEVNQSVAEVNQSL